MSLFVTLGVSQQVRFIRFRHAQRPQRLERVLRPTQPLERQRRRRQWISVGVGDSRRRRIPRLIGRDEPPLELREVGFRAEQTDRRRFLLAAASARQRKAQRDPREKETLALRMVQDVLRDRGVQENIAVLAQNLPICPRVAVAVSASESPRTTGIPA